HAIWAVGGCGCATMGMGRAWVGFGGRGRHGRNSCGRQFLHRGHAVWAWKWAAFAAQGVCRTGYADTT
ncbi:unnamed protein product, partial [Citrullus colocynthis]